MMKFGRVFRAPSEDNCPWGIIASLALNKMFEAWKLQGYTVPQVRFI